MMTGEIHNMSGNSTLKNIVKVSLSNLCIVISGVFVGFLIPKVLGVEECGYYKIFTLYATYIGIFSFGISEGVYLKYSGIEYSRLNKQKIRCFTKLIFYIQIAVLAVIILFSLFFLNGEYKYIFIALSIYLVELNMTAYYQYVAQMTLRFNDYSMRNIVKSMLTVVSVVLMVCIYYINSKQLLSYKWYLTFVLIISTVLYVLYLRKFCDITFGNAEKGTIFTYEIKEVIRIGMPFLIASMCSTLILNIDRQFVSIYFDTKTYGVYSFAYNMLSLVTVCTSAISTVIYPVLKKTSECKIKEIYPSLVSYMVCFIFLSLNAYFPLSIFVKWFLPQYTYSLEIFRIVFPGLAFSSVISVVMQNYYKLMNKNHLFFFKNVLVLGISIAANFIAYYWFKTPEAISYASVVTLIIYYLLAESYFRNKFAVKWHKNFLYCICMTAGFYIISRLNNLYVSFLLYLTIYLLSLFIFHRGVVKKVIYILFRKIKRL